jgi:hypothetical protein
MPTASCQKLRTVHDSVAEPQDPEEDHGLQPRIHGLDQTDHLDPPPPNRSACSASPPGERCSGTPSDHHRTCRRSRRSLGAPGSDGDQAIAQRANRIAPRHPAATRGTRRASEVSGSTNRTISGSWLPSLTRLIGGAARHSPDSTGYLGTPVGGDSPQVTSTATFQGGQTGLG